jgi:hypothetical protein
MRQNRYAAQSLEALRRIRTTIREGAISGSNDGQTLDALDHILDGLENAFADGYTAEQWQSIAEHLGANVHNGLT